MTPANILTTEALVDEALEIGRELNRPLRYVQINSFYNGSTGTIMRSLHRSLTDRGVDSYIFWGRRHETINTHEQCCATKLGVYSHGIRTRAFGKAGFYSKMDTKRLIGILDRIEPDVLHIHNIHGYYINIEMLFSWLANHDEVKVRWTLHDCWSFTGHCAHFSYVKCEQWKTCCSYSERCPQLDVYPKTLSKTSCLWNFKRKRECFTQIPPSRMTIITPSHWLEELLKESYLSEYPVEVRSNTIDRTIFRPTVSNFRVSHDIRDRFMILGVANPWTVRKGLDDFVKLADSLNPDRFSVVIIGLNKKQIRTISKNIIGIERVESPEVLAGIYTTANVFFNPTREDNYPTVNLEAESCGTPVITYDTGGCRETIKNEESCVVNGFEEALHEIKTRYSKAERTNKY